MSVMIELCASVGSTSPVTWPISFSYGRALVAEALEIWAKDQKNNVAKAQAAFAHRARMNGLASLGQWKPELETQGA